MSSTQSLEVNAAKEARNAYMREYMKKWRKENKEKVQDIQRRYWARKAEKQEVGK